MCQACDTPEARATLARLGEALGAEEQVARFIVHRFGEVPDEVAADEERWYDGTPFGTVTLTRGQVFVLRSALMRQMDGLVNEALTGLDFAERVGAPLDAMVDVEACKRLFDANLEAVEALGGSAATEVRVEIPDDVAALVGDE